MYCCKYSSGKSVGWSVTTVVSSLASETDRPKVIGDLICPRWMHPSHLPGLYFSKVSHKNGPLICAAFCSVSTGSYSGWLRDTMCIALSASTVNAAIDSAARHLGSSIVAWFVIKSLSWLHPMLLFVFFRMSLKLLV